MAANIPRTGKEEGCVAFDVYVDRDDDEVVWLVEAWRSDAAIGRHCEQAYAEAILDRVDDWLVEPPAVARCVTFTSEATA
ncbi:MAG TPA: hypothetical protein ENJ18_03430 [Nannocystis exedens]|nr:hypothetical protein [Nannocystis exedens]